MKDKIQIATKIEVKPSPLHRYGIFATDKINEGEVIEETMFIRTTHRAKTENRDPALFHYSYGISCNCDKCQAEGINFAIPFGYCQFTNHSLEPNSVMVHDYQEGLTALTALRDIEVGEEITMNYGEGFQQWLDHVSKIQEEMKLLNSETKDSFDSGPIKFRAREVQNEPVKRGIKEIVDQANEMNQAD